LSVRKLFDLNGKTALVTGGSRGIGLQMAEGLGEMGARVAITARKQDELDVARAHLERLGIECLTVVGDLAAFASIPDVVGTVMSRWGQIDILVNNAGTNWAAPAEDYPDDGWRKVMSLNVDAQFFITREVGRRSMIPRRAGKVVNIASIAGLFGNPPQWGMQTMAYNTSKGALVNMTRALAAEWGPYNINVNAICPGFFPSKMTKVTLERIGRDVLALTPLGRMGGDEDLKGCVVFLASEASRHITGQAIAVDGGTAAV
jgi:NAD(P)-dependent dehydrogenase (short-subunit alcohol dehydrogenase family)